MARPASPAAAVAEIWTDEDAPEVREFTRARRVLAIGGGLLMVLLLLAAVVPIGGAVIASGAVGVETRVKRIANPSGGTIAAILVENGQHVEQGQLLMRLKDKVPGAEAEYSGLSVEQLLAERARLEAEQSGSGRVVFAPALLNAGTPTAAQAMSDELKLFATRQAEQVQMHAQLDARIAQYGEQNRGYNAQICASSCSRNGISDVAVLRICFGETSMKSMFSGSVKSNRWPSRTSTSSSRKWPRSSMMALACATTYWSSSSAAR